MAFLRGINVGKRKVSMADLKKAFEACGFTDARTLLNSGNVVFAAEEENTRLLTETLEQKLEKTFRFAIPVLVRTQKEVQELVASDPFAGISITPETRLYVTFSSVPVTSSLAIPYESEEKDLRILSVSESVICSTIILSSKLGTVDLMSFLEKEYGKHITTRNWNTVKKLAAL